jgi:aspartate/methionine/tyrosine aminotransferase
MACHPDPRHQIIITPGGKWGLYLALTAVLNPGDEVLILEPTGSPTRRW